MRTIIRPAIYIRWLMLAFMMLLPMAAPSFAQFGVSITIAPPELPVYDQPVCPGEDYIWTPGFWAWGDDGYYWVPGTWVLAPQPGVFWTPGYWGWENGSYLFYDGYWGPQVGFYGGIDYGFGYFGHGYEGGRWDNGHFFYNRAVNNVNVTVIHNVYNTTVINNRENRVSFNGPNGINERPTQQEQAFGRERHIPPVAAQTQHVQAARSNMQLRASVNHGNPPIAATPRPGAFTDRGIAPAREGGGFPNQPGANNAPANPVHARDLPAMEHPAAPATGNPKMDQKYQQQQTQLMARQDQERQKLQQKQDQDHQRLTQQHANDVRTQHVEQQHQQQTQQLQQRHVQQMQTMQQRQQPRQQGGRH